MPYGVEFTLTKQQAEFVKNLRIGQDYTWGAIARDFAKKYPDLVGSNGQKVNEGQKDGYGRQTHGVALCDAAMKLLGETVEDGWN